MEAAHRSLLIASNFFYLVPVPIALSKRVYTIAALIFIIGVTSMVYHTIYLDIHTLNSLTNPTANNTAAHLAANITTSIPLSVSTVVSFNPLARFGAMVADVGFAFLGFTMFFIYLTPKHNHGNSNLLTILIWTGWLTTLVTFEPVKSGVGGLEIDSLAYVIGLSYYAAVFFIFCVPYVIEKYNSGESVWNYYQTNFKLTHLKISILLMLIGVFFWLFVQNITPSAYFPAHTIWHIISAFAQLFFVLSLRKKIVMETSYL